MKILLLSLVSIWAAHANVTAQYDPALARQITEMAREDQWARHLLDTIHKYNYSQTKEEIVWDIIHATDKKHNQRVWKIINDIKSYPDIMLVGYDPACDFWLLVQHQDSDTVLQKEVLKYMKWAVDHKQAPEHQYAFLVDRVRLNTGQKQLYGTQYWLNKDKTAYIPRPLEDSMNVNRRRAELEMMLIEDEIKYMNRRYKAHFTRK
jgi:hypothetical protein